MAENRTLVQMARLAWTAPSTGVWEAWRNGVLVGRVQRVEEPREGWAAWVVTEDGDVDAGVWATVEGAQRGVASRVG